MPIRRGLLVAALTALSALPWLLPGVATAASAVGTAAQLKALKQQIDRISREVGADAARRDRLSAGLKAAELSLGQTREELGRLDQAYAERSARRATLAAQQAQQQRVLDDERSALAGQLRAAYMIGRDEPLKLLLNQRDPLHSGRLFSYYAYFGRARAQQIAAIVQQLQELETLDAQLQQEQNALADLKRTRADQVAQLQHSHDQRQQALAGIEAQQRTRAESLAHLKSQQADLEHLLSELNRSLRSGVPPDTTTAFGRLIGRLDWPVSGRVTAQFGETRASGVKWDGMVIATARDAPVKAVSAGRVVYADWLPGLGLLVIVDHGEGYLSLYGHNDRLLKAAGESVVAGDAIAAAGDTGGRASPELYFEIRHAGRPVDPRPWFQQRLPPH